MTDQATKLITPDPAVVTHLDELQAKCLILYDLFTAYGNFEYLDNIEKAVASSLPGPPYGPHTKDDGEATFLAFDPNSPLKNQDAANRIKEMRPRMRPGIDWQPEHVKAVHKVMCTGKAGQFTLGEKIPYGSLAFFLHYCHDIIEVPVENEALIEKVHDAFTATVLHTRYSTYTPSTSLTAFLILSISVRKGIFH
ncbi:hypothetical protein FVEN_g6178 [Fusarium venenatum]|nr:hypothetical protein FVEN_g6178 [Fusarium venenatum]